MKILIVEDDEPLRRALAKAFARAGHEVAEAEDGVAGVARARGFRPDVVLLDIDIPRKNGLEVCSDLKSNAVTAAATVVMLTAHSKREVVVRALQAGASDFMVKQNIKFDEIARRVEQALANPKSSPPAKVEDAEAAPGPAKAAPAAVAPAPPASGDAQPLVDVKVIEDLLGKKASPKALPFVVAEVLAITSDEEAGIESLVKAVERDPAISANVLRLANSAMYGRGGRSTTISESVKRVGFKGVRELTVALGVLQNHLTTSGGGLNRYLFWRHCMAAGVIARDVMYESDRAQAETAFVAGLLHDIGKGFLADSFPDAYASVLARVEGHRRDRALLHLEKTCLGIDHSQLASRLLSGWGLPDSITEPVVAHHRDWASIKKWKNRGREILAGTVIAANALAKAMGLGLSGNDEFGDVDQDLAERIHLRTERAVDAIGRIRDQVRSLEQILLIHAPPEELARIQPIPPADAGGAALVYVDPEAYKLDVVAVALASLTAKFRHALTLKKGLEQGVPEAVVLRLRSEEHREKVTSYVGVAREAGVEPRRMAVVASAGVPFTEPGVCRIEFPGRIDPLATFLKSLSGASD